MNVNVLGALADEHLLGALPVFRDLASWRTSEAFLAS
jgi:hypothetical protein